MSSVFGRGGAGGGTGGFFQLLGGHREDRTRLFLGELGDRARGNGKSSRKGCFS